MFTRNLLIGAMGLVLTLGAASTASAETAWQAHHPRRVEVNHRLHNINRDIRHERREGELTARQAWRLHHAAHRVRVQERRFAARHHGHLTRAEQWRLNHRENRLHNHLPG
jgi:hypothetical protein